MSIKRTTADIKLYDLPPEQEAIWELLIESEGEVTAEIEARLADLHEQLDTKTDAYVMVIHRLERQAAASEAIAKALQAEIDGHKKRAKARKNAAERLKERLKQALQRMGRVRSGSDQFPAQVQANSRPSFTWTADPHEIPVDLQKPVKPVLNDELLMRQWKNYRLLLEKQGMLAEKASNFTATEAAEYAALERQIQEFWPDGLLVEWGTHLRC